MELPQVAPEGELFELLAQRKSTREFGGAPLTLAELAEILHSCRIVAKSEEFERRTYPSGGARFPVEIYPVVFRVDGLEAGCYHYDIEDTALELLWRKDLSGWTADIVSDPVENPSTALMMTSVLARCEVKYGARAYPFSMIEAGHMAQNIALAAGRLGIGSCMVGGYINDYIAEILDLTDDEIPVYGVALGRE